VSALFLVLWVAFSIFANSFRRSFGASPNAAWKVMLPLAVAALVLLAAIAPGQRWLLYLTIAASAITALGSLSIIRQAPIVSVLGLAYGGACLIWMINALNPPRPMP
jgi:hypothetical protein